MNTSKTYRKATINGTETAIKMLCPGIYKLDDPSTGNVYEIYRNTVAEGYDYNHWVLADLVNGPTTAYATLRDAANGLVGYLNERSEAEIAREAEAVKITRMNWDEVNEAMIEAEVLPLPEGTDIVELALARAAEPVHGPELPTWADVKEQLAGTPEAAVANGELNLGQYREITGQAIPMHTEAVCAAAAFRNHALRETKETLAAYIAAARGAGEEAAFTGKALSIELVAKHLELNGVEHCDLIISGALVLAGGFREKATAAGKVITARNEQVRKAVSSADDMLWGYELFNKPVSPARAEAHMLNLVAAMMVEVENLNN